MRARTQSTVYALLSSTPYHRGREAEEQSVSEPNFNTHPSRSTRAVYGMCKAPQNHTPLAVPARYCPLSTPAQSPYGNYTCAEEASRMYGSCTTVQRKLHRRTNTRTSLVDRQDKPNLHAHKPDSPSIKRTPAGTHGKRRCHRSDKTAPPTPWEGKRYHLLSSAGARALRRHARRAPSHPRWTPDSRYCSGKQRHSPRATRQPTSSMQRARYNPSPTQVKSVILSVQVKGNILIHNTATQRTSMPHSRKSSQTYKAGARGAPNPGHNSAARTRGPPHTKSESSGEQQAWPTCNYAEHRVHKRGHQRPTQTDKARRRSPEATHTETDDHATEDASCEAAEHA